MNRIEGIVEQAADRMHAGGAVRAQALAGSAGCGTSGCHNEIYDEWLPSAHRFSSLDDMFQRVQTLMSVETSPEHTRYCAGCHDPISLFSGAKNSGNITLSAEGSDEGISCVVCHSIVQADVQGNGDYTVEPQERYAYELHEGPVAKFVSDFLIRTYPTHHITSYSRPLYKTAEFCAACHKQYLDTEVNTDIGKVQGQNQYDSWINSRWFHGDDPTKTVSCRECHMPLVHDSKDPARGDVTDYNRSIDDRKHRSHRSLASNQYIPVLQNLEGAATHVALTEKWLRGEYEIPEIADKWADGPVVRMRIEAPKAVYAPQANCLYENDGDGTFRDVAVGAGVANPSGRSLGAVWFDFDGDGRLDLYVANDISANGVFHNLGDGTFADIGASSLAADYRGAMGLAVGDYDRDGDFDLFVTHWIAQENALFENMTSDAVTDAEGNRRLLFMDQGEVEGLGQISLRSVGWATGFADFDDDGMLDLFVVNGNTLQQDGAPTKLKPQAVHLYRQVEGKGYYEVAAASCPALETPIVGRGGAYADYDGDGRMDLAIHEHGGPLRLLRNVTENDHRSLTLRLRQTTRNRFALGARVRVECGGTEQSAQVGADGSYLSQHQIDLHFGLGKSSGPITITVHWPDGSSETVERESAGVVELTHENG